ncbi:nucleotide exchange factor GrpE [Paenalcaligenes hominis]|uniref:Protein GrpE n=1 Tax=Paenalcaligenes hominis TaxID=643674 RepID=A0ABX0WU46_9BURK|nr:nucleotide exchange factor GrpE [Paenalcaligenes hominis]NJB66285.1 molecular chaperone GrpE [Paenalcaligenes hominis]GGE74647.1 protein GrpE [Paenalcaligenes hominis]
MSAPKQPQDPTQDISPEAEQSETQSQAEELFTDANDETLQFPQETNLEAELSETQAKVAEYYDQLLRAKAEMENIRRRATEDVAKARKFAVESFAESLIPVRDSLEAALAQETQTIEVLSEGVETTLRQLNSAFERHKLIEIAPQIGDKFDPHTHQAISAIPSEHPKDTVAQVLQKGYALSDRVLRPALVMVSAG